MITLQNRKQLCDYILTIENEDVFENIFDIALTYIRDDGDFVPISQVRSNFIDMGYYTENDLTEIENAAIS